MYPNVLEPSLCGKATACHSEFEAHTLSKSAYNDRLPVIGDFVIGDFAFGQNLAKENTLTFQHTLYRSSEFHMSLQLFNVNLSKPWQ